MDNYLNKVLDDRYEIIEIIGTGGMAVVYKARDRKLNRLVAVKILKSELRDETELRRRFHAESEAVARLNHPNIINVFDVSTSDKIDYFVMELIDGITLKQYITHRRALSVKEALHFTAQILKGLEHAHAKKIVHRDIKPQNIMILRDGTAKVTDFGIARIAGNPDLTQNQENAYGSVHYIAPEQARCEATDGRADIYAVGVMLYEMLTGVLPYEGDNPVAVAMQHIKSNPKPPREINPDIPEAVEYIILKAMRGDCEKRYKTAGDMIDDIDSFRRNPAAFVPRENGEGGANGDTIRFKARRETSAAEVKTVPVSRAASPAPKRKKLNLMPILAALLALMVLLALAAALWISIMSPEAGAEDVKVPNLVGRTYDDVSKDNTLKFELVIAGEQYDSTYEKGVIIKQDQLVGKTVKAGSTINLTLSLGKKSAEMRDYVNQLYKDAYDDLKALMGNTLDIRRELEESDTITKGYIIRTNPVAGQTIVEGQTVTIYVSGGPEIITVEMPNVVNKTESDARAELEAKGFQVLDSVYVTNDDYEDGTVIGQSTPAGMEVAEGTQVYLTVTKITVTETTPVTEATETEPPATTAPPATVSTVWTLVLPQEGYPNDFNVTVYKDGTVIYNQTVSKASGSVDIPVSGLGSVQLKAYANGETTPFREEFITLG